MTLRATERRKGRLGGVKSKVVEEPAYMVDLSVTGAGVVARQIEGLVIRAPVEFDYAGHTALAVVRRIAPRADGRVHYGLDFASLDPELRDVLFSMVEERRPEGIDSHWLSGR